MAFTRRHYKAIATVLKETEEIHPEAHDTINDLILTFCKLFQEDNPRFDAGKFIHATTATTRPASILAKGLGWL